MITQRDMDNILKDVNRVFGNLEERLNQAVARIDALEKSGKSTSSTTTKTKSQEKE